MKTSIIVATIAAALVITFVSCDLFSKKEKTNEKAFAIEGQWLIDSILNKGSDSSNNLGIALFGLAEVGNEQLAIEFKNDSTFHFINSTDSAKGSYYLSDDKNVLFIKEDSVFEQLNILTKSDSTFVASSTDSLVYYLKKK